MFRDLQLVLDHMDLDHIEVLVTEAASTDLKILALAALVKEEGEAAKANAFAGQIIAIFLPVVDQLVSMFKADPAAPTTLHRIVVAIFNNLYLDDLNTNVKAVADTPRTRPGAFWTWPTVHDVGPSSGVYDGDFRKESALKLFGYTVGKKEGWSQTKRERFLSDFMRLELPPIVKETFGDEYGDPMSTTRLRKVANVIASNCQLRYRNDPRRYAAAISDWESDLTFLKQEFYEKRGLKFMPWPETKI